MKFQFLIFRYFENENAFKFGLLAPISTFNKLALKFVHFLYFFLKLCLNQAILFYKHEILRKLIKQLIARVIDIKMLLIALELNGDSVVRVAMKISILVVMNKQTT